MKAPGGLKLRFILIDTEQDAEKDIWFKKSGLLCIQHYTSDAVITNPRK